MVDVMYWAELAENGRVLLVVVHHGFIAGLADGLEEHVMHGSTWSDPLHHLLGIYGGLAGKDGSGSDASRFSLDGIVGFGIGQIRCESQPHGRAGAR